MLGDLVARILPEDGGGRAADVGEGTGGRVGIGEGGDMCERSGASREGDDAVDVGGGEGREKNDRRDGAPAGTDEGGIRRDVSGERRMNVIDERIDILLR